MNDDSSALPTFSSLISVSRLASALIRVILTCVFAIVGVLLGAMTGAFIRKETAGGMLRGSIKGAISGALSSAQVAEDSLVIWKFNASGQWIIFYVIELLHIIWSETLNDEKVDHTLQSAVQNQVLEDIFDDTDAREGVPKASVEMIPKFSIQMESNVDGRNERINCAVCLQDFNFGEIARTLPQCQHTFHLSCIDIWLRRHNSCPLCRCHT